MRQDHQRFPPIAVERVLGAVLALLIAEREERRSATSPRSEAILARAGLTEAEIGSVTGREPVDVRVIVERDRPVSVLDRARAHMARGAS